MSFSDAATTWAENYERRQSFAIRHAMVGRLLRDELWMQRAMAVSEPQVLDFGSGPGIFGAAVSDLAGGVLCIDRSPAMLAAGETNPEILARLTRTLGGQYREDRLERRVGDEQSLRSLSSGSFDLIAAVAVLEYLPSVADTIARLLDLLTANGALVFTWPNKRSVVRRVERPVNALAVQIGRLLRVPRLYQRACTGDLKHFGSVDVREAVTAAGGIIDEAVLLPLSDRGILRHAQPNYVFKVRLAT